MNKQNNFNYNIQNLINEIKFLSLKNRDGN